MNRRLILWSIVSALAGFLFGFDTVVISGAEKTIQSLWDLSPAMHGFVLGAALWGTVLGSMIGSWPTDKFGRKKTLLWIGILFLVGSLWSAFSHEQYSFMISRFIGGLAIGVSTVAAPLYISEISPPENRGKLAGMFQFNIVFGILIAFLSNYLLGGMGEHSWRWMLGIMAVPSLIYMVACFFIPESPRWLLTHGKAEEGRAVLRSISPQATPDEIEASAQEILVSANQSATQSGVGALWAKNLRKPVLLAFFVAFFNQLSGINAILYFAPRIFGLTGSENALGQSIGIGFVNLIFTFVGLWLIDRLGRRTLLYIGSFGYILSLGLCALAFFTWAPQFKAASAAVNVKMVAGDLEHVNPARKATMTEDLAKKQEALIDAVSDPKSGAQPVNFPAQVSLEQVKTIAGSALTQASSAAGAGGIMVLICIFAFIASHAVGQGAVIWVLISEIFPDRTRAAGQSLGSATHWVFAALLTNAFPIMLAKLTPGVIFGFFCFMMVLQLLWVKLRVPETKGRSLEDIQRDLGVS